MRSSHLGPVVPERCDVLAEPVFDLDTVFERFKTVMIHRYPARGEVIHEHWVSVPIYLPEVACLISLDTTSREIARELFEMAFTFRVETHGLEAYVWQRYESGGPFRPSIIAPGP